jgi:hypothetical protein
MQDDEQDVPREWAERLAKECGFTSVQNFIRENFGLYHPPADYKALRAENLRRSKAAEKK